MAIDSNPKFTLYDVNLDNPEYVQKSFNREPGWFHFSYQTSFKTMITEDVYFDYYTSTTLPVIFDSEEVLPSFQWQPSLQYVYRMDRAYQKLDPNLFTLVGFSDDSDTGCSTDNDQPRNCQLQVYGGYDSEFTADRMDQIQFQNPVAIKHLPTIDQFSDYRLFKGMFWFTLYADEVEALFQD